ncbi:MAG TPA: LemA family protein [Albitalea sp.]|nr:LemA family protein [Albitalea sp.]
MTSSQIAGWTAAAVLLFWAVGAYNRLVTLRNEISRAFAPVDTQMRHRHTLLQQWVESLRPFVDHAPQQLDAVLAACGQLQTACDVVRARPSASRPMASLRVAEETLAAARTRLAAELPARPEVLAGVGAVVLTEELAAADSMLAFARRHFNETIQAYNDALDQFPTWVIAGMFRFRGAGTL